MPAIHIGADIKTVREARASILTLLNTRAEQATIREALRAFVLVCGVKGTTIHDCVFNMKGKNKR